MSDSRSENDPLRPSDHIDSAETGSADELNQPRLGFTGWVRWAWRQLTSMRVAIILLLALAIAAIPGSLFPQRGADPNGVIQYEKNNPELFPVLDSFGLFDVYASPWFSAIYLLLFVSLIGCIIPRIKHHLKALRSRPPRTPARLARLDDHREVVREASDADAEAARAIDVAQQQLRALRYRVVRYDRGAVRSVSAERGYWRESGNLVFHIALVGVLVTMAIGGGYSYTGQKVVAEGSTFVNTPIDYSSLNAGRWVSYDSLAPYALTLDSFDVTYQPWGSVGQGQAGDFAANLSIRDVDGSEWKGAARVNYPVSVGGDKVYLLGNGYAPTIVVRNADGEVVFDQAVKFVPQDNGTMTSLGVLKVPDGLPDQLGLVGFFYPTAVQLESGAYASAFPDSVAPMVSLDVYAGDLGIDDGTPRSMYTLETDGLTKLAGRKTDLPAIKLGPGETADLPNGMGTITFVDESPVGATDYSDAVKRYVSLQIQHDGSAVWVLAFSLLAVAGLGLALFVPRRRMWVKASPTNDGVRIEYAGLARGDDPTLASALDDLVRGHERLLDGVVKRVPSKKDRHG